YSNNKHNAKIECFDDSEYKIIKNKNILVSSKTTGYQGYSGIDDWYVVAQTTPHYVKGDGELEDKELKNNYSLLNDTLKQIIEQANDLVDDIADVIINGELIAAKQRVYVLTPILDNLRDISSSLLQTITKSVYNLETVVKEAFIDDAKMASSLAIDLMDRNLYERANDCRWWALTPLFENELSKENPNIGELDKTLTYINNLYTVYTDIFLFNPSGEIITSSNSSNIIGNKLNENYITQTLSNKKSEKYFVSEFEKNKLYDNRATYVYSASINNDDSKTCGIGVVFDSEPEFKAILDDSFPKNKKGFSVFVDSDRKIISTNSKTLNILDRLDIDEKYFTNLNDDVKTEFIVFNNIDYLIAIAPSKGYREYKNSDNYTNMVYAITFLEI
ncbi:MAG: cache domain-containing protein, partial [Campylobacterota bacterium]|nr:cache domain-containing protein [Campylobacterota bacterium]